MMDDDQLIRILNTAIISTRVEASPDLSREIYDLVKTPGFQAILQATRLLSEKEGLSTKDACEIVIKTFRKLDQIWSDYVFQEGIDRLKGSRTSAQHISPVKFSG
jgi:hypothetical protein